MFEVKKVRKALIWGLPLFIGVGASCLWAVSHGIIPTLEAIVSRAPAVRIAVASQVTPFVAVFSLLGALIGSMRAIPISDRAIHPFECAFKVTVLLGMAAMVLIPVTAVVQRFYMPSIGYSICSELEGHPTMWFTDWVRDPTWCVKGKSLEWVNEQAGATVPPGTP
ncbi:hypothetical protein [Paracidovorax valerianellae]|uniref:Uncharacterized protein n=1 Tax=Paracidovorax valerianellae TaxID=187868 RepID=A0A1G6PAI1_9BURK|nr:hypothetical protein [Paracidovorax valerianellae]MDA8444826.1 hypothetical protein [Paracidovorax valerianellae]SDC77143.1 hypothetical protein SAMN05192589_103188 [Paracidovorax valerianellae]